MKRFIVLTVLVVAMSLLLAGTAMAYTDYIPYLQKGTTGARAAGTGNTNEFGILQNEAPANMPNTYDAYALGCFWCHGWEKRQNPNNTDIVDITRVLLAPNVQALGVPAVGSIVSPLVGGNTTYSAADNGGIGEITLGNLLPAGSGLPVSTARWTNLAEQWGQPYGPHGGYSNTTDRCKVCHDVHAAAGSKRLTAGNTAEDICETCHDFTQGISIYGAIQAATGVRPSGGHRIANLWSSDQSTDTAATPGYTNLPITGGNAANNGSYITSGTVIPGYMPGYTNQTVAGTELNYPQTGGVYTYTSASLASRENNLTCTDCHTPHGNTSMRPFKGDRVRLGSSILVGACLEQPTHITWMVIPAPVVGAIAGITEVGTAIGSGDCVVNVDGSARLNLASANGRAALLAVLGAIGRLDPGTPAAALTADGLLIDATTSWGAVYAARGITRVQLSGVALAATLFVNGALDLKFSQNGLSGAVLNRLASNKLLRDYVNTMDLRDPIYGGALPAAGYRDLGGNANMASGYSNYDERLTAPLIMTNVNDPANPWNNGQAGASAVYGSAFCASCHRGRIGNYAGLVNADDYSVNGSRAAARLDNDFVNIQLPPNAQAGTYQAGSVAGTMTDRDTCLNHPTLMKLAYNQVGPLQAASYPGAIVGGNAGSYGLAGTYDALGNVGTGILGNAKFGGLNVEATGMERGLALSNRGFVMWPVPDNATLHPDGKLGTSNATRPKAPICQQCHEDSRDVEAGFAYVDTDKNVPMASTVNTVLGLEGALRTTNGPADGGLAVGDTDTPVNGVGAQYGQLDNNISGNMNGLASPDQDVSPAVTPFINDGNPAFQNFPHETQNYRLLVEGGDSNRQGGGQNDDLCLNCHVPGSTIRPGSDKVIFNTLVKDFNGFQE